MRDREYFKTGATAKNTTALAEPTEDQEISMGGVDKEIGGSGQAAVTSYAPEVTQVKTGKGGRRKGQDHHFVPSFYLRRWASGVQQRLCEFAVRHKLVRPRWTSPTGSGYVTLLYGLDGATDDDRERLERDFYRPVDTRAADALTVLEGGRDGPLSPALRLSWARFLMSLMMRTPADMEVLAKSYREEFAELTPWQKQRWAEVRRPGWPTTMSEAIEQLSPVEARDHAKELATRLMENERITDALLAMYWRAIDVSAACTPLLTSDRPLRLSGKLQDPRTELVLPVGPTLLFVAGRDMRHVDAMIARGADQLVSRTNRTTVEAANDYVWGIDDGAVEYVRRHFGRNRPKSHLELLVEHIRSKRNVR